MGKIYNALEKHRNESKVKASVTKMNQADWDALIQYDKRTGKLNLRNTSIIRDPETIHRLLENKMILADGTLTSAAMKKCTEMTQQLKISLAGEPKKHKKDNKDVQDNDTAISSKELTLQEAGADQTDLSKHPGVDEKLDKHTSELHPRLSKVQVENKRKSTTSEEVSTLVSVYERPQPSKYKASKKEKLTGKTDAALYNYDAIDKNLVSLLDPQSFEAEQFKILRTDLFFPISGNAPNSILVTSVAPGEGKSFVASNLAISVARGIDRHVLLIDCDLRKPAIHRQFGFGDVLGLSDYLSNGTPLPSLLLKTKISKLSLLPAGKVPDNPSELLSSELMSALLKELTERYSDRLVIIDSPPQKLSAETSALARNVDGILLVVKYGETARTLVKELIEKIGKDKILGIILNYCDKRSLGYYGSKAYRKYKGQYYK